jgi:hypothetical protein
MNIGDNMHFAILKTTDTSLVGYSTIPIEVGSLVHDFTVLRVVDLDSGNDVASLSPLTYGRLIVQLKCPKCGSTDTDFNGYRCKCKSCKHRWSEGK